METDRLSIFSSALLASAMLFPASSAGAVFMLKDGAKIEGELIGRAEGSILVKTKYGTLTLKDKDISKTITDAEADRDDLNEEGIEVINSKDIDDPAASYVFSTVVAEDGSAKIFYFRNTDIIATETLDINSKLVNLSGNIPDRTFTEYYENSKVKSVKKMKNGKPDGAVISYYPDGTIQFEGNYSDGMKNGTFTFFSPKGLPLIKAEYKNDKLDGPKYEYGTDGKLNKTTWYKNDEPIDSPEETVLISQTDEIKTQNESLPAQTGKEAASPTENASVSIANTAAEASKQEKQRKGQSISVKSRKVARGILYSFYLNNRYIGKARLDKDYNVIMSDGKIPDGTARLYGKNDILQMEFIFRDKEIKNVIIYDDKGQESAQYSINEKGVASKLGI